MDMDEETIAIFRAAATDSDDLHKALFKYTQKYGKKFDFNTQNKNGNTIYHVKVMFNDRITIMDIGHFGFDINTQNKYGDTVLHIFAKKITVISIIDDHIYFINEILREANKKFDVTIKNNDGFTCLDVLKQRKKELQKMIEKELKF